MWPDLFVSAGIVSSKIRYLLHPIEHIWSIEFSSYLDNLGCLVCWCITSSFGTSRWLPPITLPGASRCYRTWRIALTFSNLAFKNKFKNMLPLVVLVHHISGNLIFHILFWQYRYDFMLFHNFKNKQKTA